MSDMIAIQAITESADLNDTHVQKKKPIGESKDQFSDELPIRVQIRVGKTGSTIDGETPTARLSDEAIEIIARCMREAR
jgi:hypothetical protein